MNKRVRLTLNNIFYAFTANGISLAISAITTLIVPKVLGVNEYSYWQLYIFYTSYVGFFAFGWVDGIYLKYGGIDYDRLEYPKLVTQFWMLIIFELIMGVTLSIYMAFFISNVDKRLILLATCLCGFITIIKSYFLFIFELTNRIEDYAKFTKIDRYIYFTVTITILLLGVRDYKILLLVDIIARFIALIMCLKRAPEVAIGKLVEFQNGLKEAVDNISIGSKLMVANIASMLIIGIVRFGIEKRWNIETFGRVSLTLSISNFLLTMINAVGVVMFPMLRRTSREKLPIMYGIMRTLLMIPLLAMLIFYIPIKIILSAWLPQYAQSLNYMALLFPICIFECKMALLINTYLKTLRKEKWILIVNISALFLSLVSTGIIIFVIGNLALAIASIVILLAFRCILAETMLSRYMNLDIFKDSTLEVIMVIIFITFSWTVGGIACTLIYLVCYIIYLVIKRNDIKQTINIVKPFLKQGTSDNISVAAKEQ